VLEETDAIATIDGRPMTRDWLVDAEAEILLAEGDREGALDKANEMLEIVRSEHAWPKEVAAQVWWIARVFGEDEAGGTEEVESARKLLEELHATAALRAPDLVLAGERTA
jgi:hypothetical protein